MAKVTYSADRVVSITIKGEPRGAGRTFEDGGLVSRFLAWTAENKIYPAFTRSVGGGAFFGAFWLDDACEIEEWLRANGAKET